MDEARVRGILCDIRTRSEREPLSDLHTRHKVTPTDTNQSQPPILSSTYGGDTS